MTAPDLSLVPAPSLRAPIERWRRRSRVIRILRVALPALIGLILAGMAGSVAYNTLRASPAQPKESNEPIRLVNPRFIGRDEKGRAFVLTAVSAMRDPREYQRVILDRPALVADAESDEPIRIFSKSGVYHEGDRKLELSGGVRLSGARTTFETAESQFDTRTGELVGSGPVQGAGSLGEIHAKSYGVYGKGDRMVFKGGVRARLESK